MITYALPYDRPPLMSNRRLHYMAEHRKKQDIRQAGFVAGRNIIRASATDDTRTFPINHPVHIRMVWSVPTKHRRDADAGQPTLKSWIDGIVSAGVLVDDSWQHVPRAYCEIEHCPNQPMSLRVEIEAA